jgi:putative two-component system hydrogenase maturation factor HypX/HoxX
MLFLTSAHNSLSQRLLIELGERGHEMTVCVAATSEAMIAAATREAPELILAPMLKIAIPEAVWSRHLCLIVHPGSRATEARLRSDWAIANNEKSWGVSILEAATEFDAGPIWASHEFALEENPPRKAACIEISYRSRRVVFSKRSPGLNRASSGQVLGNRRSLPM